MKTTARNINMLENEILGRDIAERTKEPEPIVIGKCIACGEILTTDYEYCTDDDGNLFCTTECALDFYGVREVNNE